MRWPRCSAPLLWQVSNLQPVENTNEKIRLNLVYGLINIIGHFFR